MVIDTRYSILFFTLGIILRYYATDFCPPVHFCGLFLLLLSAVTHYYRRTWLYYSVILSFALCAGIGYAQWRAQLALPQTPPLSPGLHTVQGYIVSLPEQKEASVRFHFRPEQESSRLLISAPKAGATFLPGQYWSLKIRVPTPTHYYNPGGTNFSHWLIQQGIHTQAYLQSGQLLAPSSTQAVIHQLRAKLQHKIEATLGSTQQANLILALTIGDQSRITEAQWQQFREAGIIHLVSISGLHVTMLAGLLIALSRRIFQLVPALITRYPSYPLALITGFTGALAYSVLAGFSIPTQRTIFMLLVSVCALLSQRNLSAIQIWLYALLAVLLLEPAAVLSVGFWLSFLCVGALILSGVHTLCPDTGIRQWIKSQWVASLASLAILAVLFQRFPLLSPLANAVAIPLVSMIVTPLSLLGLIDPSGYLLKLAHQALVYHDDFIHYLLQFPHTYHFAAVPAWTLLPALFATVLWLLPAGFPARSWAWTGFLPLFLLSRAHLEYGQWRAIVIDVGQGLSVLVQTRQHHLVFDTGRKAAAKPALLPLLQHYGVHALDTLILSHDDNDHTGGAALLMQQVPIQRLISSLSDDHPLLGRGSEHLSCLQPVSWEWDGVHFTLFSTLTQRTASDDNARSCVLKVHSPTLSMLIPGDIGFREEADLIQTYSSQLDVDIVVAPHHGSRFASSEAFVHATSPRWAIFSAGRHNRYRHPHPDTLARYEAHGSLLLRTDETGAVCIRADSPNIVTTFLPAKNNAASLS